MALVFAQQIQQRVTPLTALAVDVLEQVQRLAARAIKLRHVLLLQPDQLRRAQMLEERPQLRTDARRGRQRCLDLGQRIDQLLLRVAQQRRKHSIDDHHDSCSASCGRGRFSCR